MGIFLRACLLFGISGVFFGLGRFFAFLYDRTEKSLFLAMMVAADFVLIFMLANIVGAVMQILMESI